MLDRLRGIYAKSPRQIRRLASLVLRFLPVQARFGSAYQRTRQAIVQSQHDAEFVRRYRHDHLQQLLALSLERCRHYQPFLLAQDLSDPFAVLRTLPVLNKAVVRENLEGLLARPKHQLDAVSTSGSTGQPLVFYLDQNRSVYEWAFINHIWGRIGYAPNDTRAMLRGVQIDNVDQQPWEHDRALNELRLSPFHLGTTTMTTYLRLLEQHRVGFIHGYPSAIYILGLHALRTGWKAPPTLKGILPISETLYPHQRQVIGQAFGNVPIQAFYGLSEKVCIAAETSPDHYEFEPLYGITEILDEDGHAVQPGTRGRIVSTGLVCKGMPLLRYDTGDSAVLLEEASASNAYRLRVKEIRAQRHQEFLVGHDNALISLSAINLHSPHFAKIKEFQFHQDTPGAATLKVIPANPNDNDFSGIQHELQRKIGKHLIVHVQATNTIAQNPRGKRVFVDQHIQKMPNELVDLAREQTDAL